MKCVIVPVRDIEALKITRNLEDKIYTLLNSRYKEIDYDHDKPKSKFQAFQDLRGRTWEWFIDESYYDQFCVRTKDDNDFNSPISFHFNTFDTTINFINLLKQAR